MSDEMKASLSGLGYGIRMVLEADCATIAACLASLGILLALCALF